MVLLGLEMHITYKNSHLVYLRSAIGDQRSSLFFVVPPPPHCRAKATATAAKAVAEETGRPFFSRADRRGRERKIKLHIRGGASIAASADAAIGSPRSAGLRSAVYGPRPGLSRSGPVLLSTSRPRGNSHLPFSDGQQGGKWANGQMEHGREDGSFDVVALSADEQCSVSSRWVKGTSVTTKTTEPPPLSGVLLASRRVTCAGLLPPHISLLRFHPPATAAARRPPSTPPGAARTGILCVSTPSRLPGTEARCRCRCATDQGVCGACGRAPPFPQLIVSRRKAAKPINFSSPSFPSERGLSELSVGESRFSLLRARVRLHNQAGRFRASSI